MIYAAPRLVACGDAAILIEFADEINDAVNDRVHALAHHLRIQQRPEILDLIPAYASLFVCYDPAQILFAPLADLLRTTLASLPTHLTASTRLVEIPTRYGGESGPDLKFLCEFCGMTEAEVVRLHSETIYRVYLIGFTPGFAYLGSVPTAIAAPRLDTPRTHVPAGSVGIAGRQTGIYPTATPGGWRLIGHTDAQLFAPRNDPPTLLRPGDRVKFVPC